MIFHDFSNNFFESLPSRERGLKFFKDKPWTVNDCVAPFTGAWIEITLSGKIAQSLKSLPSRERGLK